MHVILKRSNKIILLILNLWANYLCSQTQCYTQFVKDTFAYELSANLWSEDDMIYRRASLVKTNSMGVTYGDGLYLFEYGIDIPKDCQTAKNKSKIKYFTSSLNDSIHSQLEKIETSIWKLNEYNYKLIKCELEVLFIGKRKMKISDGKRLIDKVVPCYLILDFVSLNSLKK